MGHQAFGDLLEQSVLFGIGGVQQFGHIGIRLKREQHIAGGIRHQGKLGFQPAADQIRVIFRVAQKKKVCVMINDGAQADKRRQGRGGEQAHLRIDPQPGGVCGSNWSSSFYKARFQGIL